MSDTSNTQILNALKEFRLEIASQTRAVRAIGEKFDALDEKVDRLCVEITKLQTWRDTHAEKHGMEQKQVDDLARRVDIQAVVMGAGEAVIAAIAFWR